MAVIRRPNPYGIEYAYPTICLPLVNSRGTSFSRRGFVAPNRWTSGGEPIEAVQVLARRDRTDTLGHPEKRLVAGPRPAPR
jgi:hypothetical protein